MPSEYAFPDPVAVESLVLRVGVMAHMFYVDLIDEFTDYLSRIPTPFVLMVSVMDVSAQAQAQARFSTIPNVQVLHIRIVPNRGRDIAPLLVTFRDEVLSLDVVGHIHTKKSLYTGSEQASWRRHLLETLLGSAERIGRHLGRMQADPKIGILYPESFHGVPAWAHTWLSNLEACRELGGRLGLAIEANRYIDFPTGSMFWARVNALRPLYQLELKIEDFPPESGQTDGTLQHAVERLLVAVVRQHGSVSAVIASDGTLATEGRHNWPMGLDTPLASRLLIAAIDAVQVSSDVFDTLVLRPFLTPHGARAFLAHRALTLFGTKDFADLRERAESKARSLAGRDPTIDMIYLAMGTISGTSTLPLEALKSLELELEANHIRTRQTVVDALASTPLRRPIMALSDMYLGQAIQKTLLPREVTAIIGQWQVSCDSGLRKDSDLLWSTLPDAHSVSPERWLHIGDNEHSDIQLPQRHHLATPVHIPRPAALLDLHPHLRPLRPPRFDQASWADQLWLGLLANHAAEAFDHDPDSWLPYPTLSPHQTGYMVLGPLVLDYLAWLTRVATARSIRSLLFLSREGHLLFQAFTKLQDASPSLTRLRGHYLPASRRASGTASLHDADDLPRLLSGSYNGTMGGLLRVRLGEPATNAIEAVTGGDMLSSDIYLPEMRQVALEWITPAMSELLAVAKRERGAYQEYWLQSCGDAPAMVADLGYSGSIQASLARMLGRNLDGGYFALSAQAAEGLKGQWAAARHHDGRNGTQDIDSVILRHDLLLESLLTAPHPQFSHFSNENGRVEANYAAPELRAAQWKLVEQVHAGALAFIADACAVVGDDIVVLEFDSMLVQRPLQCIGNGRWRTPWLDTLGIEDAFTGRGWVAAR
ncbi:MAG: polysaccharide biosynthesis protein [Stenotrophomonas acidaminiphila]|nr:MAG: polysaccharide biosynthesis protein [Stenotrophomonas acidaminiphila]